MVELIQNPLTLKVIISLIPLLIKEIIKQKGDLRSSLSSILSLFNYIIPITVIIWMNIDCNVTLSKLSVTIIAFNFFIILLNLLQPKINVQNKTIIDFIATETDKVKQINQINEVQSEKMRAIIKNQEYILSEISKINDRIINLFIQKKKK